MATAKDTPAQEIENVKKVPALEIGKTYFIETITSYNYVGRLVSIDGQAVVLEEAAWIANSGRLNEFMRTGKADGMEIEPVGIQGARWAGWRPWPHKLFTKAV